MKYSIIIPTHNRPDMLSEILEMTSKIDDCEIIICENNSTMENLGKYKEIALPQNASISFNKIDQKFPLGAARNIGVTQAKGDFLFFLDDDDKITEEFISLLNGEKSFGAVSRFCIIKGNKKIFTFKSVNKINFMDVIQVSSYLFDRKIFKKISFKENVKYEDAHFAADLLEIINYKDHNKFSETSINYNVANNSMMRSKQDIKPWIDSLELFKDGVPFKFGIFINLAHNFSREERLMVWKEQFVSRKKQWTTFKKLPPIYGIKFILWKFFRVSYPF